MLKTPHVPVVQKDVLWSKRCKDPAFVGTVKEVILQISHSKKWPGRVQTERNGKTVFLNSYSLLQDRFYEHMKAAGFDGFERGERGSTTEHLDVTVYKLQQDNKRIADLAVSMEKKKEIADNLTQAIRRFPQKLLAFIRE